MENVWTIIPALNEAGNIDEVLKGLVSAGLLAEQIVVVDGGSEDETVQIAESLGAEVLIERRRGYGLACLEGLSLVEKKHSKEDLEKIVILFIDADGSDSADDALSLVQSVCSGNVDFALGSRLASAESAKAVPPVSRMGNKFCCAVVNLCLGGSFTDLGPLRAITWPALEKLQMADQSWGWTLEMQIKALRAGLKTNEVPVSYKERLSGESKISGSLIGGFRAGTKIIFVLLKHLLFGKTIQSSS